MKIRLAKNEDYASVARLRRQGGAPYDTMCGAHGKWAEGDAYFEYHPLEAANKFIYVVVGQDAPLFDENSILISQ